MHIISLNSRSAAATNRHGSTSAQQYAEQNGANAPVCGLRSWSRLRLSCFLAIATIFLVCHMASYGASQVSEAEALLSPAAAKEVDRLVPNFGVVSSTLWRGGQPKDDGFFALKKAGVKTIINLRDGAGDIARERAIAEQLGLKYVSIPLSSFGKVSRDDFAKFLQVVEAPENQPVFVHCRQGQDRSGTMVAMYRIVDQGWTYARAYSEMIKYGYHPFLLGLSSSLLQHKDHMVPVPDKKASAD
jgi:protein tyrosine phosphatase (PTP) superfamily phosphohydrolase (DUF442 family)